MPIDVMKLALDAGAGHEEWIDDTETYSFSPTDLARFAALVLEEAAKITDSVNNSDNPMTANDCSDAIRALKP